MSKRMVRRWTCRWFVSMQLILGVAVEPGACAIGVGPFTLEIRRAWRYID